MAADQRQRKEAALRREAAQLQERIEGEVAEARRFDLDKGKLSNHWAVQKKRLVDVKLSLATKEREIDGVTDAQQREITTLKQKLKHLLLQQHADKTNELVAQEVLLKQEQDLQRNVMVELLRKDQRQLKKRVKEAQLSELELALATRKHHDAELHRTRRRFDRKRHEIKGRFEHDSKQVRERMEEQQRRAVDSVETAKRKHAARLAKEHEAALNEIREFFVDVTHTNLEKIKEIKEEVAKLRKQEANEEAAIRRLARENARMAAPLQKAQEEEAALQELLRVHGLEKQQMREVKAKLLVVQEQERALEWEAELRSQKLGKLQNEIDELRAKHRETHALVDRRNGFRTMILRKRLHAADDELFASEAKLQHVLTRVALLEPTAVREVTALSNPLEDMHKRVKDLQMVLDRTDAAYQDLITAVHATMDEHGIPRAEMGFEPYQSLR